MDTSGEGVISLEEFTDVLLSRWDGMEKSRILAEREQLGAVSARCNMLTIYPNVVYVGTAG